jgi:hypothetical protein
VPLQVTPIAAAPLHRVSARSLYHRTEPSPPFLSPGAAHVASTHCTAIKGGPPVASRPRQRPCPPPVSRHFRTRLCFPPTPSVPSHLTSPLSPCAGPRALPKLGVAPRPEEMTPSLLLSSGTIYHAGELHISVAHPPHCELVLSTISGKCMVVHGRCQCSPSHRSSSRRSSPTAPRGPCWTTSGQAMPYSVGSLH